MKRSMCHLQPAIHTEQQAKVAVGVKDTSSDRPPIGAASPQKKQCTPTKPVSLLESLLHSCNLLLGKHGHERHYPFGTFVCKSTQLCMQPVSSLGQTMLSTSAGAATPYCGHVCQGTAGRPANSLAARRGGAAGACSWSGSRADAAHATPVWQIWRHGDGITVCGRS